MKIAVLVTSLPLDGIAARESLDLIFALAAVDHQVSVIFSDDAVYQLVQADDSAELMVKDFRRSFKLFELYDIENLYICADTLVAFDVACQSIFYACRGDFKSACSSQGSTAGNVQAFGHRLIEALSISASGRDDGYVLSNYRIGAYYSLRAGCERSRFSRCRNRHGVA